MAPRLAPSLCQSWLQLNFVVLTSVMTAGSLGAQTIDSAQVPSPNAPITQIPTTPPPQDVQPPLQNLPIPQIPSPQPPPPTIPEPQTPSPLPPPDQLLQPPTPTPTTPEAAPGKVPQDIPVKGFEVVGSTVFSPKEFDKVLAPFSNRRISFAELFQARSAVTQLYIERGYITSGALIPPQTLEGGEAKIVKIQVVEGELEGINVTGTRRLNPNYVRSRLRIATSKPLNRNRLLEALQLLQLNPLIENLSAELSAGTRPASSLLEVRVTEADTFNTQLAIDNGRTPSVGSFRRRLQLNEANLLGQGDGLSVGYANTDGSNDVDVNYTLPLNPRNGTLSLNYINTWSNVIEPPFNRLDIEANSRYYDLTLRQPVVQTPSQEFALGLTASRRESKATFIDNDRIGFPSPGADREGRTQISALRFFQEWTQRSSREVLAARSQFSLGLGALDATVNSNPEPDSRFFAWRGQGQWVRLLAPDTLLVVRGDVQLATTSLVPLEQFGLGGQESVRGYRQDALLTDNGAFASAELRIPIYRVPQRQLVLQIAPFVDVGTTWNNSNTNRIAFASDSNTLASVGLGLRLQLGERLTFRLDWGIPLVDIPSRGRERTWQENGVYFSIVSTPF